MLKHDDDDVTTWKRGFPKPAAPQFGTSSSLALTTSADGGSTASALAPATVRASSAPVPAPATSPSSGTLAFAPPQLRRKNIVTEDTNAWTTARAKKPLARKAGEEEDVGATKTPKLDAAE